jgi:broad specificity phosphatase PhoE
MRNTIILVRHGESDYNLKGVVQGNSDYSRLTDLGVKQAEMVGTWLSELSISSIFTSPLKRAVDTAGIISKKCSNISQNSLLRDKRLEEVDFGSWQGKERKQIQSEQNKTYKSWRNRPFDLCIDEKYPIRELYAKVSEFLDEKILNNSGIIVVVAHKGTISAIINILLKLPKSHHHFLQIDRGSVSVLQKRDDSSYELVFANELPQKTNTQPINFVTEERTPSKGEVFLVRHGQTESNIEKKYQGSKDIPLSDFGIQKIRNLAQSFTPRLPVRVYTSPLKRAKCSADIITEVHKIHSISILDKLQELGYGVWEGMSEQEVIKNRTTEYYQWLSFPAKTVIPNAEHISDAYNRCAEIWEHYETDIEAWKGSIISVAHDISNRLIICNALDLPPSYIWAFKQTNATVSVLAVKQILDGKLRMLNHSVDPIKNRLFDEWL